MGLYICRLFIDYFNKQELKKKSNTIYIYDKVL